MPTVKYWKEFLDAFVQALLDVPDEDFSEAWRNSGNRTWLYENVLLGKVAGRMGLTFKKEEFKVDYTLCKSIDENYDVPVVFVESENNASTAYHEIRKLCCFNAPLKVLIVCAEWSDAPGAWAHGGCKKSLINKWSSQIRAHNKVWASTSVTGIIVAEWNQSLKYYALAFDHFGEIVDEHRIVFERAIG